MARIRTIKPEFPQSESVGRLSREARLCFILLWTLADDSGRLRGNSRMLASLLYPYDDDAKRHIDGWIGELERESCASRYQVEGETYIQINNWLKHQKIDKPSPSKIPPNPRPFANPREDSEKNAADQGRDQGVDQGGVAKPPSGKPDPAVEILDFLNLKAKREFRPVPANLKLITARLHEGASTDDCRRVIENKVAEWATDAEMSKYLRPGTLFCAEKFAQYVGTPAKTTQPERPSW